MTRPKYSFDEVLCFSHAPKDRATVRSYYLRWRAAQNVPSRCDDPECPFHTVPLLWNGRQLPLILDHKTGNARDNSPQNLRLLCPNCDSQNNETRGGRNIGRIAHRGEVAYEVRNRNGTQDAYVFPQPPVVYSCKADKL